MTKQKIEKIAEDWGWTVPRLLAALEFGGLVSPSAGQCAAEIIKKTLASK